MEDHRAGSVGECLLDDPDVRGVADVEPQRGEVVAVGLERDNEPVGADRAGGENGVQPEMGAAVDNRHPGDDAAQEKLDVCPIRPHRLGEEAPVA